MTQLAIVRARLSRRRVAQGTSGRRAPPATKVSLRPRTLVGLAVLIGLATGLIELAMHLARRLFINPSSLGALQLNQHALWTVPVSDALIFGICGLIVAIAATVTRSSRIIALGLFGLCFLGVFAFLLTFRGLRRRRMLDPFSRRCVQLTRRIRAHPQRAGRLVKIGLPGLVASVTALSCLNFGREKLDEVPAAHVYSGVAERPVHRSRHRTRRQPEPLWLPPRNLAPARKAGPEGRFGSIKRAQRPPGPFRHMRACSRGDGHTSSRRDLITRSTEPIRHSLSFSEIAAMRPPDLSRTPFSVMPGTGSTEASCTTRMSP